MDQEVSDTVPDNAHVFNVLLDHQVNKNLAMDLINVRLLVPCAIILLLHPHRQLLATPAINLLHRLAVPVEVE